MKRFARDVLLMALATGASRLLGLARDASIAARFGASAPYDAFLIAFFLPHVLRSLLAEGALSTAFVPIYTRLRLRGTTPIGTTFDEHSTRDEMADRFASNLLSWLLILFPLLAAGGILLAPSYVPFLASGFADQKLSLAIELSQWVFPFIALIGFAAVFMGLLNAHHRFFVASFAPVWFNVGMLAGVLGISLAFPEGPIFGVAVGVLLGGAGQLLSQVPALHRLGFRFRFHLRPLHPALGTLLRRMAPAIVVLAFAQVNLLVDNKIASHLPDGGISSLQFAMRLFQLPLGVFAVSIATALLPRLAASHAVGDRARFARDMEDGMAVSALVLLPATAGLILLGQDVVRLLFEHGQFGATDTLRTAGALWAYAVGLLPYGLVYVATRAAYAMGRTGIPMIATILALGVNIGLDLALVGPLQERGLALATAVAGGMNAVVLLLFLRRDVCWGGRLLKRIGLVIAGTGLLAILVFGTRAALGEVSAWLAVLVPTVVGVSAYVLVVRFTALWGLIENLSQA